MDPRELYSRGVTRVNKETEAALQAGRRRYGREFSSLAGVAEAVRADPENHFGSAENVRKFIVRTMARAKAAAVRIVPQPPMADVELRAFPEFSNDAAPGGQYVPPDDAGTRPPLYYYRTDYQNLAPSQL